MNIIASHSYYEISRKIEDNRQLTEETEHSLTLFPESIECARKTFRLGNVFDISYKTLNSSKGFLYLHTHQGIFSFYVKQDPYDFIRKYKKLLR